MSERQVAKKLASKTIFILTELTEYERKIERLEKEIAHLRNLLRISAKFRRRLQSPK